MRTDIIHVPTDFKVSQEVICKPGLGEMTAQTWLESLQRNLSTAVDPCFVPTMFFWAIYEVRLQVTNVDNVLAWILVEPIPGQGVPQNFQVELDVSSAWILPHASPTPQPTFTCVCPSVSFGCTCGAFKQEMEAKGMVYDKWAKMWVNP